MSGIVDTITGRSASLARAAQDKQAALLAEEKAKVKAVEEGQRLASQIGGGGLLAYVDQGANLRKTFGG